MMNFQKKVKQLLFNLYFIRQEKKIKIIYIICFKKWIDN